MKHHITNIIKNLVILTVLIKYNTTMIKINYTHTPAVQLKTIKHNLNCTHWKLWNVITHSSTVVRYMRKGGQFINVNN